ncbi:DUF2752 domain-containing protein [Bacteroides sp. 51]|uniref:DUF2752 domain-containing protein n=1 Tax=Bacteroides sp. 51 TaxID=2302938 RepID=UPI0013D6E625|nr:DUF2752 domain-containing protein [Bacteroides sp. 51]NDV80999.1 DUF2752 domain-containing protein [Bacteroides sp. 51]
MFYTLTGLECPACGSQRAVHQFLHLNIAEGIRYNPFLFISIPYLTALVITKWFDPRGKLIRLKAFCNSKWAAYTYFVLFIVWWIVRNLI